MCIWVSPGDWSWLTDAFRAITPRAGLIQEFSLWVLHVGLFRATVNGELITAVETRAWAEAENKAPSLDGSFNGSVGDSVRPPPPSGTCVRVSQVTRSPVEAEHVARLSANEAWRFMQSQVNGVDKSYLELFEGVVIF